MSDQAERICAGLVAELKEKVLNNLLDSSSTVTGDEVVERVLADKLLPLLRAGQAMRDWKMRGSPSVFLQLEPLRKAWDAALARCEEKCK